MKNTFLTILIIYYTISLSLCEISLNLSQQPIIDQDLGIIEYLLTTQISLGSDTQGYTIQSVPDNSIYETYVFESSVCQASDTTSNCWVSTTKYPMYQCTQNCVKKTPETKLISDVEALNGYSELTLQEGKDYVSLDQHDLQQIKLYFVSKIGKTEQVKYFQQGARASLGLGIGNENFLSLLKQKNQISTEGFSIWLYKNQNKLNIGKANKFFADGNLKTYNEVDIYEKLPVVQSPWIIKLDKVMVYNTMLILYENANPSPSATISTTSGFLSLPWQHYSDFYDKLKNVHLINCDDYAPNLLLDPSKQKTIKCDCSDYKKFPDITFYFTDNSQSGTQSSYNVEPRNYLQPVASQSNQCIVLVRMQNLQVGDDVSENWVLGTPFLKSVYTYFDNSDRSVKMAKLYEFEMQPKIIETSTNTAVIIVGLIILLIAISALLILLKRLSVITVAQTQAFANARTIQPVFMNQKQQQQPTMSYLQNMSVPVSGFTYSPQKNIIIAPNQSVFVPVEQQKF